MAQYFVGKGYGVSDLTDLSGRPLLTYQGQNDKKPILLSDRCAVTFDPTVAQQINVDDLHTPRLDDSLSSRIKDILGGTTDDELDHKIPLELGGSNLPVNLMIQPGRSGGVSALSDTLETTLAARVAAGQISLQVAWAAIAQNKGFVLGEENPNGVEFSFLTALGQVVAAVGSIAIRGTGLKKGTIASETQAQIDQNMAIVKDNPFNQKARLALFQAQILATQQKTGLNATDAATAVRTLLNSYGSTSGLSKQEVEANLTILEQRLLGVSRTPPTILGIESQVLIKVLLTTAGIGGITLIAGAVLVIIGAFIVGPEALASAGIGFSLSSISTAFGLNAILGTGVAVTEIAGMIAGFSFIFGMGIKLYYDNVILAPTQLITAFKDTLGIEKSLGVGFQMVAATKNVTGAAGRGTSSNTTVKVFSGIVSSGVLQSGLSFTPRTADLITNSQQLQDAAQNNLAPWLQALPSKIIYEVKIVPSITLADGTTRHGTTNRIQTGTHKNGTPIYKTITNKFATLTMYVMTDKQQRQRIATIVLGPTDSSQLTPTSVNLTQIATNIKASATTIDVSAITSIKTATPVQVTPLTKPQVQAQPVAAPIAFQYPTDQFGNFSYDLGGGRPIVLRSDQITPILQQIQAGTLKATAAATSMIQNSTYTQFLYADPINALAKVLLSSALAQAEAQISTPQAQPVATPSNLPPAALAATTLSDFYGAQGKQLPSVAERAKIYQALGLGVENLYVGTAEQNTTLLAALKK